MFGGNLWRYSVCEFSYDFSRDCKKGARSKSGESRPNVLKEENPACYAGVGFLVLTSILSSELGYLGNHGLFRCGRELPPCGR
jgi:hypothetical protein